jgi:SAM-dependent methyltransferase
MIKAIKSLLTHPLTYGLDINSQEMQIQRQKVIQRKLFLKQIYQEWYSLIVQSLPKDVEGPVLELGSGGGFLKVFIPDLITSDVFLIPGIHSVIDGQYLPFPKTTLKGIVMVDVLHHIPRSQVFFKEAARCVKPGGVITMIEPWVTHWSRIVYSKLHHEPFEPDAREWDFPHTGPLSGANGALPWIIFHRDRTKFESTFPEWHIQQIHLFMPFRYLISGGVSMQNMMPHWTFKFWRSFEILLKGKMDNLAMFANITLIRREDSNSFSSADMTIKNR